MLRAESWRVLEDFYKSGKLRSIGVSNYTVQHLEHLMEHCTVVPHVNQVRHIVEPIKLRNMKTTFMQFFCVFDMFIKQIVLPIAIKPVTELNWSDYCYSVSHVY